MYKFYKNNFNSFLLSITFEFDYYLHILFSNYIKLIFGKVQSESIEISTINSFTGINNNT